MATKRSQRIGIWIIAGIMIFGTVGGFIAMVVSPGNQARDKAALEAEMAAYSAATALWQKKVDAQQAELSQRYFEKFSQFTSNVVEFSPESIDKLQTDDLVVGDGREIGGDSQFAIYYLGWNPQAKMFDSSFNQDKTGLDSPLFRQTDGLWVFSGGNTGSVIEGWQKGVIGMKVGGVRQLTIPADLAYGEAGGGEDIPANTPLRFIVMAIDAQPIPTPEIPELVKKEYSKYGQ